MDFSEKYLNEAITLAKDRVGTINERKFFSRDCKLAVNAVTDQLLGFFLSYKPDIPSLAKEMRLTIEDIEKVVGTNDKIYVAETVVLQKNAEKHGLATTLVKQGLENAKKEGCYSAWSPLWIKKDGSMPSKKFIERLGFSYYKTAHMRLYYVQPDFKCVDCGGRCTCDDAIYYKIL